MNELATKVVVVVLAAALVAGIVEYDPSLMNVVRMG